MSEKTNENRFSSFALLSFLTRWWKHILIVTVIGAVVAIIVSYLLPELYRSVVVFYPDTTNSVSQALLDENADSDFLEFGDEDEAEQVLQILQSDKIQEKIVEKYNLYSHYDIDSSAQYAETQMNNAFAGNVNFRRTKFNSVEISVLDEVPNMAANIANSIALLLDSVYNQMQHKRAQVGYQIVLGENNRIQAKIQQMEDSLQAIRDLGINDYASQAEVLNQAYGEALAVGNTSGAKRIKEQLNVLSKYGGIYVSLTNQLELYRKHLSEVSAQLAAARVDANSFISHKIVVDYAVPANKKTFPKRKLIVIGATLATFFMCILVLIGIENYLKYRNQIKPKQRKG